MDGMGLSRGISASYSLIVDKMFSRETELPVNSFSETFRLPVHAGLLRRSLQQLLDELGVYAFFQQEGCASVA
jgi:hypothetical protein